MNGSFSGNSLIGAIGDFIDAGRVKVFCVGSNNHESFLNKQAHPLHRSWRQRMFDEYIRDEVIPYMLRQLPDAAAFRSRRWARRSARTTPPTRCFTTPISSSAATRLSGIFDLRDFMGGMYDDNFYFQNPVDYLANLTDPWFLDQLATCEIRLATGSGPCEKSGYSYALSGVLARSGIRHSLDDWGPLGGHDWPYWKDSCASTSRAGDARSTGLGQRSGRPGRQIELVQQILPVGDHLLVVDPDVAVRA